jgi:hypothetical protein
LARLGGTSVEAGVLLDCRITAKTILKKEIRAFRILRHVLAQLSLSRRTWKPKLESWNPDTLTLVIKVLDLGLFPKREDSVYDKYA